MQLTHETPQSTLSQQGVTGVRLLSVRATADLLGVHENTVLNWEERGLLQAVRLPGSGFRRFPADQLQALVEQLRSSFEAHPNDPGLPDDVYVTGAHDASQSEQDQMPASTSGFLAPGGGLPG